MGCRGNRLWLPGRTVWPGRRRVVSASEEYIPAFQLPRTPGGPRQRCQCLALTLNYEGEFSLGAAELRMAAMVLPSSSSDVASASAAGNDGLPGDQSSRLSVWSSK